MGGAWQVGISFAVLRLAPNAYWHLARVAVPPMVTGQRRFAMSKPPTKANTVFKGSQGADWQLNACVGDNGGPYDLYDYAQGYFEATRVLITAGGKTGCNNRRSHLSNMPVLAPCR